jgi:hypothetical protein
MRKEYKINLFRCPDEAYIIKDEDKIRVLILEKKEQSKEGSVETKLWASPALKREYQLKLGEKFSVEYKLCLNSFYKRKIEEKCEKYTLLCRILEESDIDLLYGEDKDYFDKLNLWIF